eukprot:1255840-Rhodomonas_salina.2
MEEDSGETVEGVEVKDATLFSAIKVPLPMLLDTIEQVRCDAGSCQQRRAMSEEPYEHTQRNDVVVRGTDGGHSGV